MDCPICMECILPTVNCVTTDCGHLFHTSCLMKNTAVNGYDCPCCRTQLAEEPDDSVYDSDEEEFEDEDEEEEDYVFMGFRWFFQQINGEELEGDAEEYEEFQKEEKEWDQESEAASEEIKGKIDNILLGLNTIKTISYEELLKAFLFQNMDMENFTRNHQASDAFYKVNSTIRSISERSWS